MNPMITHPLAILERILQGRLRPSAAQVDQQLPNTFVELSHD